LGFSTRVSGIATIATSESYTLGVELFWLVGARTRVDEAPTHLCPTGTVLPQGEQL